MSRRYYNLPPMKTLVVFEAAARHLSFKNAARELSVTPGAISHQIKALEGELGTQLFRRLHRGVELTVDGVSLFETLASSFAKVSQSIKTIQAMHSGNKVTIGSTSAVASHWLSHSVVRFWRTHPDVDVNQSIQDEGSLNSPEIDLHIRYGRDAGSNMTQTELFRDHLVPVASQEHADRLTGCDLDILAGERLIHLDSDNKNWTTWQDWFLRQGYDGPIASGIRLNNYSVALQVAQDGGGIALGWQRLIRPIILTQHLFPISPHVIAAPHRFYLVGRPDSELTKAAMQLKRWIIKEENTISDEMR